MRGAIFIYFRTFLVTVLVLGRYLARSVLVVAYIFSRARPWPGINRNRLLFSPVLLSCVRPRFASSSHLLQTRNRAVGATRAQHGLHCYASPCVLSHTHTHTHTHSLSLPLSLRQWDNNHAHRPLSSTARVLTLGRRSDIILSISNSCADPNSAIQWVSSITSQTMELRIAIDVQVLYSRLHLFKKNRYETCK